MRSAFFVLALAACNQSSTSGTATPSPDAGSARDDAGTSTPDGAVDGSITPPADAFVADPIEQDYDDVATVLANALRVPGNVAVIDGINMAYGTPPAGFTSGGTGIWTGTHDGIAYTYTYHCGDIYDNDSYTCGPGTDHIHWSVAADGTAAPAAVNLTEDKLSAHWIIRSIGENKPRVEDGAQLWLVGRTANDNARISLTVTGTWTHVFFDPQPTVPTSGTIAISITGHRSRASSAPTDRDFTMTAAITFGAQSTIQLDSARMYSIDMTSGAVARM